MAYHEEGKWWVSQSNFEEDVLNTFRFPKKIEILDTTLRDGEQQPSVILTKNEKVEIAKRLDKLGVQRIEAGTPAVLEEDAEAIREISSLGLNADIYAFVRNMVSDMKYAKQCGVDGVIAEIIGSEQLLEFGKKWTADRAIKACIEATQAAHEMGLKITFFPADSSRADMGFLLDFVHQIREKGHIDSLTLVDTFGVLSPEGAYKRVSDLKKEFPELPLEVHFHDDFNLGVAATIAGLSAGAEVAHVTLNGIGERAGNTQLEATVLALEALYGVNTGIDMSQFYELSRFIEKVTKAKVAINRPVVGEKIFLWETGLPSSLWVNARETDPLVMLPYKWNITGQKEPYLLLGKKSGKDNVTEWLKNNNLEFPEEKISELLKEIKEKSYAEKRDITNEEFLTIVNSFEI